MKETGKTVLIRCDKCDGVGHIEFLESSPTDIDLDVVTSVVRYNVDRIRKINKSYPEYAPFPNDAPCYYCDLLEEFGEQVCRYCIHSGYNIKEALK